MAAAHVSGAVALLLAQDGSMSPADVLSALKANAHSDVQGTPTNTTADRLWLGGSSSGVIDAQISTSLDDIEEVAHSGWIYTNSSDLEIGNDWANLDDPEDEDWQIHLGLRFQNINIPIGSTITNAYIQFTTDETSSEATDVTIWAEASDDAAPFVKEYYNVSARNETAAAVRWTPGAWTSNGAAGSTERTSDLSTLVNEVVSRPGWAPNNDLVFMLKGSGSRIAEAYDGDSAKAPRLHIEYAQGFVGSSAPTTGSVAIKISSNEDDVEENKSGGWQDFHSSDLELAYGDGKDQLIGMRFIDVQVPAGATITDAYVQFTTDETSSGSVNLTIRGQATGSAAPFESVYRNVKNRMATASSVNWAPAAWTVEGQSDANQRTSDISSIISEIVSRGDWSGGNAIVLMIDGTGTRTAESHNGSAARAPVLHIDYSM